VGIEFEVVLGKGRFEPLRRACLRSISFSNRRWYEILTNGATKSPSRDDTEGSYACILFPLVPLLLCTFLYFLPPLLAYLPTAGDNKGRALIQYSSFSAAKMAASHMNRGQIDGGILTVEVINPARFKEGGKRPVRNNGADRYRGAGMERERRPLDGRDRGDRDRDYRDRDDGRRNGNWVSNRNGNGNASYLPRAKHDTYSSASDFKKGDRERDEERKDEKMDDARDRERNEASSSAGKDKEINSNDQDMELKEEVSTSRVSRSSRSPPPHLQMRRRRDSRSPPSREER